MSQELIDEILRMAPSEIELTDDEVIIKHVYIERRMVPLNFSCGALNYAPFRLGALARVAWHVRVDGMNSARVSALMAMAGSGYLFCS